MAVQVGAVLAVQRQHHILAAQRIAAQVFGQAVGVPGSLGVVGGKVPSVAPCSVDRGDGADLVVVLALVILLLVQLGLQFGGQAALGLHSAGFVGED